MTAEHHAQWSPYDDGRTPEYWDRTIDAAPDFRLHANHLVVVAPHPDDETLGAGGLIQRHVSDGALVSVVVATDGEIEGERERRREELRAAMRTLGRGGIRIVFLGLPDGGLNRRRRALDQYLDMALVPTDLLVVPWEADGHPDHEAAGRAGLAAAKRRNVRVVRYPVWGWHHGEATTFEKLRPHVFQLSEREAKTKARALSCYRSQLEPRGTGNAVVPPHVRAHFERPREVYFVQ